MVSGQSGGTVNSKNALKHKGLLEKTLRRVGVGKRFFLIFILLSFIPMLFVGLITYNKSQATVENKVSVYCKQINRGIRSNFELLFRKVNEYTIEMIYNNELQDKFTRLLLEKSNQSENEYFSSNDIMEYLKRYIVLNENAILKTSIVTVDKSIFNYDNDYKESKKVSSIISDEIFNRAVEAKGRLIWSSVVKDVNADNYVYKNVDNGFQVSRSFTIAKKNADTVGVFSVLYSSSFLKSAYDQIAGAGDVYLVDENNIILYSNKKEEWFKEFPYADILNARTVNLSNTEDVYFTKIARSNVLLTYSKSAINGWGIAYTTPYLPLVEENREFGIMIIFVSVILLVLTAFVALVFSSSVSNPLRRLTKLTGEVKMGRFDVREDIVGKDEITVLSLAFNDMIQKVEELIKEVYETKIREKDFKLKALQAQINPHFLYNTLDAIRWSARTKKDFDISRRVENLTNLFRLILSDDSIITTLDQEIKYTEYYLFFHMQNYKDKLHVIWDVDEAVRKFKTIKLLLQPLVENSIIHGMIPSKEKMTIKIIIKNANDEIFMRIEDDGAGADPEAIMETLNQSAEQKEGIALKNVNDRIKEFYGDRCGIKFYSEIGVGTAVEIVVPKKD